MSNTNNATEQAFPFEETGKSNTSFSPGLTKREYFAGLAMIGLLFRKDDLHPANMVADKSILYADELLKKLESAT